MKEWQEAGLVLSVCPYGEGSILVHLFTEEHGVVHGIVRGGGARRNAATWQVGNLVMVQWKARLTGQLGSVAGELVQSVAARCLDYPVALSMLSSACAVADGALPQDEAHPEVFMRLVRLLTLIGVAPEPPPMAAYLRWEACLLSALGYGLDLRVCAVTGTREGLEYVSPKTGRAVSVEGAGEWRDRLLPLPSLFLDEDLEGARDEWCAGIDLTGYFLERWVFGVRHKGMPLARGYLRERLSVPLGSTEDDAE
ncbi:DNA repair protein RecO [Neokomagataea thailandica]|uniref:DNA repair protein RecO n=1 Tax=Neokomagataea tanensis NBRC 106556 TaxID=1223519 RepID=A0ABQ0QKJ7_9PROT|nr:MULTISPECIES: DNA repair protein RecO [Neokomagataea]GBR48040.1 DNA repair protein RecO [Neokomagataea tanensis NBRC 106556]